MEQANDQHHQRLSPDAELHLEFATHLARMRAGLEAFEKACADLSRKIEASRSSGYENLCTYLLLIEKIELDIIRLENELRDTYLIIDELKSLEANSEYINKRIQESEELIKAIEHKKLDLRMSMDAYEQKFGSL